MALLKSVALGTIAGIAIPFVLTGRSGLLGALAQAGTYHPPVGALGFAISGPIFLAVTGFGWLLLNASANR